MKTWTRCRIEEKGFSLILTVSNWVAVWSTTVLAVYEWKTPLLVHYTVSFKAYKKDKML